MASCALCTKSNMRPWIMCQVILVCLALCSIFNYLIIFGTYFRQLCGGNLAIWKTNEFSLHYIICTQKLELTIN
jgi:hypothetical protein